MPTDTDITGRAPLKRRAFLSMAAGAGVATLAPGLTLAAGLEHVLAQDSHHGAHGVELVAHGALDQGQGVLEASEDFPDGGRRRRGLRHRATP